MPEAPKCHQSKLAHRPCAKCGKYLVIVHMPIDQVGYYCPTCCPACNPDGADGESVGRSK
jgi:hypothetical protein